MNKIKKLFTEHPHSIGETYFEHLICAAGYGLRMIVAGIAAIIHSFLPFLFETTERTPRATSFTHTFAPLKT